MNDSQLWLLERLEGAPEVLRACVHGAMSARRNVAERTAHGAQRTGVERTAHSAQRIVADQLRAAAANLLGEAQSAEAKTEVAVMLLAADALITLACEAEFRE